MNQRKALLLSGGIGDFLHYIVRFSSFIQQQRIASQGLSVFVESTNPQQVQTLFKTCLPEVTCQFIPRALHWTKTNPLLDVNKAYDRIHRPAYQYVLSQDAGSIEDWFLPFLCMEYSPDVNRIDCLRQTSVEAGTSLVLVSLRDKGFLWWPSREALLVLRQLVHPQHQVIYVGLPDEKLNGVDVMTSKDVLEALKLSCQARLFVGTDTGLATARELLGLANIYCVNKYWYQELMVRYSYWNESMNGTLSRFAFNISDLETALGDILRTVGVNPDRHQSAVETQRRSAYASDL